MNPQDIESLISRCRNMIKYQSSIDDIIELLKSNGCDNSTSYLIYMASRLLNEKDKNYNGF